MEGKKAVLALEETVKFALKSVDTCQSDIK